MIAPPLLRALKRSAFGAEALTTVLAAAAAGAGVADDDEAVEGALEFRSAGLNCEASCQS